MIVGQQQAELLPMYRTDNKSIVYQVFKLTKTFIIKSIYYKKI